MGILKRFKDIMSANVNAILDRAEDPEKMIDQYLRDLESDLGKVKAETAAVMAEEARCKRVVDENQKEIDKMVNYAQKALMAGNEADAKVFLNKKLALETKQKDLQVAYEAASTNARQMRDMHDKLTRDIATLQAKKQTIKTKMAVAKTQEHLNQIGSSAESAKNGIAAFERMEAKADRMLDEANAMAELNSGKHEDAEQLMNKYDGEYGTDVAVDLELEAMKAKLGL